mgnify:FL=1
MATLKYSRQREAIKEYLNSTKSHPTADSVYLHVKEEFPNISLGTVYRNLNLLADTGDALKISTPDGGAHFDGDTTPHYHVICTTCGKIYDLQLVEINALADAHFDGTIDAHTTLFYGTCSDCENRESTNS